MWGREPDANVTVEAGSSKTAAEALGKMGLFTSLCMRHKVDIVESGPGATMVVSGRPKRVKRFYDEWKRLHDAGAV